MVIDEHIQTAGDFLAAADREFDAGDILQGSEKLWGAASHALIAAAQKRGWQYHKHGHMKEAARRLYRETSLEILRGGFLTSEQFHANFYHDFMEDDVIEEARFQVRDFVIKLLDLAS